MTDHEENSPTVLPLAQAVSHGDEELPYRIVICGSDGSERVLARAASAQLAHAIYAAATKEHPNDRLVLRKNGSTIVRSESA